jgi:hypothetical protein
MVPLSEYASVSENDTLAQALQALQEAQRKLPPGRQPNRAILVRDAGGNFVGKIDHFAILDALLPWHEKEFRIPMLQRAWVSEELARQTMENLALLHGHLSDIRERALSIRVGDIASQEAISIEHNIPLVAAIRLLVQHQTLSLLVRYDDVVVGVLRLSDIFDHLSDHILESGDDVDGT